MDSKKKFEKLEEEVKELSCIMNNRLNKDFSFKNATSHTELQKMNFYSYFFKMLFFIQNKISKIISNYASKFLSIEEILNNFKKISQIENFIITPQQKKLFHKMNYSENHFMNNTENEDSNFSCTIKN